MDNNFDIAIIGMACRFPGADDLDSFWNNLANGVESISHFTDEELRKSGIPDALINNPNYVKASPIINEPGMFDARFFGFTPMEAKMMDPQHRVLLECAYEALEHSGYDSEKYNGRIGVFTGSAMNTYFMNNILRSKFVDEYIPTLIGNDKDFLSTRISYKLNLKGPSINVQTACSTSLVAVHLACQSLISEESDMVLAGAVSVKAPHKAGYICDGGGIVSRDAHVRAFDAKANGTIFGSGCGIVVLKRLSDAIRDGDTIHAVIKGSALNNDGSEKAGYTAPSVNSQADVVIEALSLADIAAETITYVEAHGSGTPIGDPIELAALTKAFRNFTENSGFCAIGSVKTNVGHLDAASGMAGLIKTVLSIKNKKIPPSINYSKPNPEIDFNDSPFFVNTQLTDWKSSGPKRAGIMSTGMGGTNAYLILEEAPVTKGSVQSNLPNLLLLSAKSETALDQSTKQLSEFLSEKDSVDISNVAYTLQKGRKTFNHRRFLVCKDKDEAVEILKQEKSKRIFSGKLQSSSKRPVIFLFPGISDHYVGMGYDLYQNVKVFKDEVDKCAIILKEYLDVDIRDILYPTDYNKNKTFHGSGIDLKKMLASKVNKSADSHTQKINQTLYAQPALFTIEYALAKLWMHIGITPDAIVGHSMGEYVAACLAGVFSLEDALKLIAKRARLVNDLPQGAMIAVTLPENELAPLLNEKLSISLINSPNLCVVAGAENNINQFEGILKKKKILYRHVQNAHAFHSKMLDPIYNEFVEEVKQIKLKSSKIPYTSNLTGNWISEEEAIDPVYWAAHANNTARFSNALEKAWQVNNSVLLEVGPGNTLSMLAMQHPESRKNDNPTTVASLRPDYDNQSDLNYLLTSIGKLWISGIEINWDKLYENKKPKRIPLPAYPFQQENYWIENRPVEIEEISHKSDEKVKRNEFKDWFYIPSWKRSVKVDETNLNIDYLKNTNWLIFSSGSELEIKVINNLNELSCRKIIVKKGNDFSFKDDQTVELNHRSEADFSKLFQELNDRGFHPDNILHFWNYDTPNKLTSSQEDLESSLSNSIYSLLFIAKSLQASDDRQQIRIGFVTKNLHSVLGDEQLASPEASMILGSSRVVNKEIENVLCRCIDFSSHENNIDEQTAQLLNEFAWKDGNEIIAYRGKYRWIQSFEQVDLVGNKNFEDIKIDKLKPGGVYLIIGGTGGLGLVFAEHFAKTENVKLILTKKTDFPERAQWKKWIEKKNPADKISNIINKIIKIEELGSNVEVQVCDIANENETKSLIDSVVKKYGKIDGIIHAAGIVNDGILLTKSHDSVKRVLSAKVFGTNNIANAANLSRLDFLILFSSVNSFLAPVGQVDYSSANNYLDAFASFNLPCGTKVISVNWPGWRETGILAELEVRHDMEKWKQEALDRAISNSEGVKALSIILNNNYHNIIVFTETISNLRVSKLNKQHITSSSKISLSEASSLNISRSDADSAPTTATEKALAQIWKDILGINEVNKNDNFFNSGGHSLLAIQLISTIRKCFQTDFSMDELFNSTSLSNMAAKINDKVLVQIESINDEEVFQLI